MRHTAAQSARQHPAPLLAAAAVALVYLLRHGVGPVGWHGDSEPDGD